LRTLRTPLCSVCKILTVCIYFFVIIKFAIINVKQLCHGLNSEFYKQFLAALIVSIHYKGRDNLEQISFEDLIIEENKVLEPSSFDIAIMGILKSGINSAREICEILIKEGKLSNNRYSTDKPMGYRQVCSCLDQFVLQGKVLFIEDQDKLDRIYELKN
jgi:Protein of unknown function (DUF3895)